MHIKVGFCDDIKEICNILEEYVSEAFNSKKIEIQMYSYTSGEDLLQQDPNLDLLFLDIEMPGIGGIETGRQYHKRHQHCKIMLASGREDLMKDALSVEPCRFIDKPFDKEKILVAIEEFLDSRIGYSPLKVSRERRYYEILQRNILYIRACDSDLEIITKDGRYRYGVSLKHVEKLLDDRLFFRVNRTIIVNMMYVNNISENIVQIGEGVFQISRRNQTAFLNCYRRFDLYYRG